MASSCGRAGATQGTQSTSDLKTQKTTQDKTQDKRSRSRSRSSPLSRRTAVSEKLCLLVNIAQELEATRKNFQDFDEVQKMEPGPKLKMEQIPPKWILERRENFRVLMKRKSEQIENLKEEIINFI